jgi:sugar phosphate permease
MAFALRANCGPRWLSGFLTLFMAFLLRAHPIDGHSTKFLLAAVIGAAGVGNFAGIALASELKRVDPRVTVVLALLADVIAVIFAALAYGLLSLVVLGLVAGLSQSLAKLALDATIQRDVAERVRTSAFARSDTTLQLAWVIGGFVGIAMPLDPRLGMSVAAVVLLVWALFVLAGGGRRTPRAVPAI